MFMHCIFEFTENGCRRPRRQYKNSPLTSHVLRLTSHVSRLLPHITSHVSWARIHHAFGVFFSACCRSYHFQQVKLFYLVDFLSCHERFTPHFYITKLFFFFVPKNLRNRNFIKASSFSVIFKQMLHADEKNEMKIT